MFLQNGRMTSETLLVSMKLTVVSKALNIPVNTTQGS